MNAYKRWISFGFILFNIKHTRSSPLSYCTNTDAGTFVTPGTVYSKVSEDDFELGTLLSALAGFEVPITENLSCLVEILQSFDHIDAQSISPSSRLPVECDGDTNLD